MSVRSKRWGASFLVLGLLLAQVVMPVYQVGALASDDAAAITEEQTVQVAARGEAPRKVYVCKYVGVPYINERIQTGQNPIEVSANATRGAGVGSYFLDGQGRSYVLAVVVPGQPAPSVAACPNVIDTSEIVITQTPVCGSNNDIVSIAKPNHVSITQTVWGFNNTLKVYATRDFDQSWSDGDRNLTKEFTLRDANVKCDTVVAVPAQPSVNDPCGLQNASWVKPADSQSTRWVLGENGTLTAFAKDGYIFQGGVKSKDFGVAQDSGKKCVLALPETPSVTDVCGADNATWVIPERSSDYNWIISEGDLVVEAVNPDYAFDVNGTMVLSYNYGTAPDSNELCPVVSLCTESAGSTVVTADTQFATYQDTRAKGHYEFTPAGLRIWTEDDSSLSKVAWYKAMSSKLADIGTPSMDYTSVSGINPGLQLALDFDANGTFDGYLVGESIYGNDWWLTNSAAQFAKDNAPEYGTGYGSVYHGTLNGWLAKFPNADVMAIGFSLGSGVKAEGVLKSVTFGCFTTYFKKATEPTVPTLPVGGSGGAGQVDVPTVTTVATTPAKAVSNVTMPTELPMTGSNGSIVSTWVALLAAILTYGAVLYLQPKKRFEQ